MFTFISSVQSLTRVESVTPCTPAHQVSLSITNSCPLSRWCHRTVSSSVVPFSSHLQSFPASGSFKMSQLFPSGGQSIGVSASTLVLPMNIHDWSLLGWTGWISLQSKGLSRVFSNTTVQKHQFFSTQLSLQSNSHIHIWLLEKPQPWLDGPSCISLNRLKAGGEGDNRGWDGWMASPTQWTGVWVGSGSCWWTGRPGVLQFTGSQRVGHD